MRPMSGSQSLLVVSTQTQYSQAQVVPVACDEVSPKLVFILSFVMFYHVYLPSSRYFKQG